MTEVVANALQARNNISNQEDHTNESQTLLHCPIRGQLNTTTLAKDGLTVTEEARRIDFLNFLLDRGYPLLED